MVDLSFKSLLVSAIFFLCEFSMRGKNEFLASKNSPLLVASGDTIMEKISPTYK